MKLLLLLVPVLANLSCILGGDSSLTPHHPRELHTVEEHGGFQKTQLQPRTKSNRTHYSYEQLYQMQTKFLDAFIYPANQKQVNKPFFSL